MTWKDATVIVTGASRGIGRAVAERTAERGARVGLIARSRSDLESVLGSIEGRGAVAVADVADNAQVRQALSSIEAQLGPTDVLIANAGIGAYGLFAEADIGEMERLVRTNLLGTIYPMRAVLPGMLERGRGRIVVVASVAGRFGAPYEAVYSATKFAQVGLAEAVSTEVAGRGIEVSIVNPGVVQTDFFSTRGHPYDRPFPRPVPADRVAQAVLRAAEGGGGEYFAPRWFRPALAVRHLAPRLYGWGTRKSFTDL